jgi:hypothetical protein
VPQVELILANDKFLFVVRCTVVDDMLVFLMAQILGATRKDRAIVKNMFACRRKNIFHDS